MSEITQLLASARGGDPHAVNQLYDFIHADLRQIAAQKMARESPGHTLQPTALVHEAWLRLGADAPPTWENRAHFFSAAAEAMRRILVDRARRKQAQRRGDRAPHVDIAQVEIAAPVGDDQLLALDEALEAFAREHRPKADLVKLRFFVGLTLDQAASALGISTATADRWWSYSRAWLFRRIERVGKSPLGI